MNGFLILFISVIVIITGYATQRFKALFNTPYPIAIAIALLMGFLFSRLISRSNPAWLYALSTYLLAFLICATLTSILIDVFTLINAFTLKLTLSLTIVRIAYFALLFGLFAVGLYMAKTPQTAYYAINVNKSANIDTLRVVQVSDLHIDATTGKRYIEKMVARINALNADLIVITGDILDSKLQPFLDQNLAPLFARLTSTYGTLAVFGNHEYYGIARNAFNTSDDVLEAFRAGNITVLQDSALTIPGTGIVVIGRDDYAGSLMNHQRATLDELTAGIASETTPIIVLDHQPFGLPDAAKHGVDVMFSGHTHAGQIFPATLIVKKIYDNPWGLYRINGPSGQPFYSIVTSGYGLWGPPIRLLTRAEIVVTDITFGPPEQKQNQ